MLLMIGDKDTTAIGKDARAAGDPRHLGHYPVLGRKAAAAIPSATLMEFPNSATRRRSRRRSLQRGAARLAER